LFIVIPGRERSGANPESSSFDQLWIPGSRAKSARPGMTGFVYVRRYQVSLKR
jgi:hypothetical protein